LTRVNHWPPYLWAVNRGTIAQKQGKNPFVFKGKRRDQALLGFSDRKDAKPRAIAAFSIQRTQSD
jgi:hypothetical protein